MQKQNINSFTSFDFCEVTKTLFVEPHHLSYGHESKVRSKKNIYNVNYNDIKMYIKRDIEKFLEKGYKVVLEHKKRVVLLIYNK
jgi:hypothetical protein